MPTTLRYTAYPNLFWGNTTLEKPVSKPNPANWQVYPTSIKINWIEPYLGLVKLNAVNFNYCQIDGKYYFAEPVQWFGRELRLYRLVYDFWVNEYLDRNIRIEGTLTKTNNKELVLEHIDQTIPLIEGGNKLSLINLEHDEASYVPALNFRLNQVQPWISYYDPQVLQGAYKELLEKAADEADKGNIEVGKLVIPALLYTSKRFKWWFSLLEGLAQHLNKNIKALRVYEVISRSDGLNYEQYLANFRDSEGNALKRLNNNRFILIGTDSVDFSANTTLSTYKIKELDFSTLKDVRYLGEDLTLQSIPNVRLDAIDVQGLPTPEITKSTIANYELVHHDLEQVLNVKGQYRRLTNFKLGEIKDYNQKTKNGEVLADGNLEVLVGFKDLEQVKDWEIEVTQAAFLEKHGIYEEYPVKKGDIVIPLSKYHLQREKRQEKIDQKDRYSLEHHDHYLDLLKTSDYRNQQTLENSRALFGDDWYEREALVIKPVYDNEPYYTFGYLTTEPIAIKGEYPLIDQSKIYLSKIVTVVGDYEYRKTNPELLEAPTENKPILVEYWKKYMEHYATLNSIPYIFREGYVYITIPSEGVILPNIDEWEQGEWHNHMGIKQIYSKAYKVKLPAPHLLSKFLRDWDNPDRETKWVKYAFTKNDSGTTIKRYYQGKEYNLFIPTGVSDAFALTGDIITPDLNLIYTDRGNSIRNYYKCVPSNYDETDYYSYYPYSATDIVSGYRYWYCTTGRWIGKFKFGGTVTQSINEYFGRNIDFVTYLTAIGTHWDSNPLFSGDRDWFGSSSSPYLRNLIVYGPKTLTMYGIDSSEFYWVVSKKVDSSTEAINYSYYDEQNVARRIGLSKFLARFNTLKGYIQTVSSIPVEVTGKAKTARNPKSVDLAKFSYADVTKHRIPDTIPWFDPLKNINVDRHTFFDLVGTNYLLSVKKEQSGEISYRLILKDPSKTIEPFKFKSYKISTPIIIDNPVQVVNQFNSLHFFGQEIPIKARSPIANSFKFDLFNITPLELEGVDSAYEYRYLEFKTKVDEIRKVFSTMKEYKNIKGIDQFKYEELRHNHEIAKELAEHGKKQLDQQRKHFREGQELKLADWEYKYKGQGQRDWEKARDRAYYNRVWSTLANAATTTVSLFAAGAGTGGVATAGAISAAVSSGNLVKNIVDTFTDPTWDIQERDRAWSRDLEERRLKQAEKHSRESYALSTERYAIEDRDREFKQRRELIAATNSITLSEANDIHIHKALSKELELGDVYLSVNYPDGWLLDKLTEHYNRYGYDLVIPNYILDSRNLVSTGPNIKFDYIERINITDPIVRTKLSFIFLEGVRLRNLVEALS